MSLAREARDVLLIGGDGFLGRPIARALVVAGRRVSVLSRGNHPPVEGAERLLADRADRSQLRAALEGRRFDLTVDLAAYQAIDVERLWSVPGASLGRTVMISSGQVYLVTASSRPSHREPDSRRSVMTEPAVESPEHGQWSYGVGKRAAEAALLALRRRHGVRAVILRLPVVQGEGDPTLRLWAWLERMLDGGPVPLPDRGRRATRFVEASDVARLIERMAAGKWPSRAVYNLAAPRPTSLRRFLELAARASSVEPEFVAAPMARLVAEGLDPTAWPFSHRWSSVLDPTRARRDLEFTGAMPAEYLPRVVRWHLEHRPATSHRGYVQREREREVCARILAAQR